MKVYIYDDGVWHYCSDGYFTNVYSLDSDNFICTSCQIQIPKILTISFNIQNLAIGVVCIGNRRLGIYIQNKDIIKDFEAKRKELEV